MNTRRVKTIPIQLLLLCAFVPLSVSAGENISESMKIAADGLVRVENTAGEIVITTWDRNEVSIDAELGDEAESLEVSETANGVLIRVENRSNLRRMDGTELELKVPVGVSLEVESVSADIAVEGIGGALVNLVSVSGDIELASEAQRVEIQSVSGDVEYAGTSGRTQLETVSGEITVSGISGEISIQTVSGEVSLTSPGITHGRFEAVSGDLELELGVEDAGRLNVDNMSGDIMLSLPEDQQLSISAQTFSGDIGSDFGAAKRTAHGPGSVLQYESSGAGAKVRLESFSGDIHIRRR